MRWESPNAFFLLLSVPVVIALYCFREKKSVSFPWIGIFIKETTPNESSLLSHLPFILKVLSLIFLSLAIARPQKIDESTNIYSKGIDIILCLDISDSMRAEDIKPNRLYAAKKVVSNFIFARKNDRIGLVIYGSEAFLQCPLTLDHRTVQDFLSKVDFSSEIGKQTAIGLSISLAVEALRESSAESKIIILLTDGVNNVSEIAPEVATEIASKFHIKIYTIGLGIPGEPKTKMDEKTNFVDENFFVNTLDEEPLKNIANSTGGLYFNARGEDYLQKVYQTIDTLEKTDFHGNHFLSWKEYFIWLLIISFTLFLSSWYMERKIYGIQTIY